MKRDMKLLRSILLHVEEHDSLPSIADLEDADEKKIAMHVLWATEANLLSGGAATPLANGSIDLQTTGLVYLPWKGCDFIDAARDETVWNTAIEKTGQVGGSVSFAILVAMLIELSKEKLGLNP